MKIGVLIDRLNVGGVEKIAIQQVKALRSIGIDAYLVILRDKAVVENAFPDLLHDIPIIYLDRRLPAFFRISFQFPVFHFFQTFHITYPFIIPFILKKNEFDYLIVHGTYTAFSAITIRKFASIPFSAFIWDPISYILDRVYSNNFFSIVMPLLKGVALFLDKQILKNSDVILVGGDAHNDFFKKIVADKKIIVISPSVNPSNKITTHKKEFILMVTAWKEGKNPEYILKVLKELPNIKIKMVGKWLDKAYYDNFMKLVKKEGFAKQIEVTGAVSEQQLVTYYSEALVVLQTNDDRGFGLPALEAAAHGTTFIIPEGQGVCNLFKNKEDGFFIKEKDTEKIISLINLLIKNKKIAYTMGKSGWKKVMAQYSWDQHGKTLLRIAQQYSNIPKKGL